MAGNTSLGEAREARKDEFYTQLTDIEKELRYYRRHFKGKTILCNCDDPFESNFFKYFALNFNKLGLKKLIATSYDGSPIAGTQLQFPGMETPPDPQGRLLHVGPTGQVPYKAVVTHVEDATGDGAVSMLDVAELFKLGENKLSVLDGSGDFRSDECLSLLDEADIVATNPPFSLFREYVHTLIGHEKKFVIIGNVNAISYKEFFPLLKDNEVWIGASIHSGDRKFYVPDDYPLRAAGCGVDADGRRYIRVKGVRWFTNLDLRQRHEELILVHRYNPEKYPHYVNYDAIEVSKTSDIPCDYAGEMGVPITFMDRYNPSQFEIIGYSLELARPMSEIAPKGSYMTGGKRFYSERLTESDEAHGYRYHREYDRIVIRNKHPEQPKL